MREGFLNKVRKLLSTPLTLRPPSQEQVAGNSNLKGGLNYRGRSIFRF